MRWRDARAKFWPVPDNALYYGDNLGILRNEISDASVDLVYLDPPFNSKADYNILFKEQSGEPSQGQIKAFTDTWEWSESAYQDFVDTCHNEKLGSLIAGFLETLGRNAVTAYLVMMAPRLLELHRVLKPTGSLYLHCDPTASHYLKLLLDCIFGPTNFRNEIVWKRSDAHNDAKQGAKRFGRVHDVLFFYSISREWTWNTIYNDLPAKTVDSWYRNVEPETGRRFNKADLTAKKGGGDTEYEWKGVFPPTGRFWAYSRSNMEKFETEGRLVYSASGRPYLKRYLDESKGIALQDFWDDISMLRGIHRGGERLGYPTQKPQALLERIIKASSNEGDVVLDPFCGCGTAVAAAQTLKRRWIGIDITHLAVSLIQARLRDTHQLKPGEDYAVYGVPETASGARALFKQDPFEFQKWAVSLVPNAYPQEGKTADKGVDGRASFAEYEAGKLQRRKIVIQVKGGKLKAGEVRDFAHVIQREGAVLGLFVTMNAPSKKMEIEAGELGFFTPKDYPDRRLPVFQFRTVEQLLGGNQFELPPNFGQGIEGIKRATRAEKKSDQGELFPGD